MRVTPLGFCLRVIVNEKPLNLEKTTSGVLSVLLLIYAKNLKTLKSFCPDGLEQLNVSDEQVSCGLCMLIFKKRNILDNFCQRKNDIYIFFLMLILFLDCFSPKKYSSLIQNFGL